MPSLSLREASRRFAVSRATLAKHLENGTISGTRDEAGNWRIDAAELARAYRPRPDDKASVSRGKPDQLDRRDPPSAPGAPGDPDLALRLARAEAELAAERDKVALLQSHLDDLRRLLPAPESRPKSRWWPFKR